MPELDNTYRKRATLLIQDARNSAHSSKTTVALRNYWNSGPLGRVAGAAVGSILTSAASAGAVAGALAGGVALGAATFGIGPAVGVVLTYGLLKTLSEVKYQRADGALKKGMSLQADEDDEDDERQWVIRDPSLLVPATMKVLKKFTRVKRRAAQLGGGASGVLSTLRHAKTAAKSFLKNHGVLTTQANKFKPAGCKAGDDAELSDRLYELRFYGQMLFNFVHKLIDDVAIKKRDEVADASQILEAHILRQVHFTGNHLACTNCYGMPESEFQLRASQLGTTAVRGPVIQAGPARRLDATGRIDNADSLMDAMRKMQKDAEKAARMGTIMNDRIATWGFRSAVAMPELKNGATATGIVGSAGAPSVAAVAQASGGGAGAAVVFAEVTRAVTNYLTRRSVLKAGRVKGAFDLLQAGTDARAESFREFKKLMESEDVINRAPRVAEKSAHYIQKLDKIQEEFLSQFNFLHRAREFDRSQFHTCDEAYKAAWGINYFFRNCEKFIAFLVYLEVILLQIDLQVSKLGIGVNPGDLIKPDRPTPAKPVTSKVPAKPVAKP